MDDKNTRPYKKLIVPNSMRSTCWRYFGFPGTEEDKILHKDRVICKICKEEVGYYRSTTNLFAHLRKHDDVPAAPGEYHKKVNFQIKGTVLIEEPERFPDDKSVASAECSLSVCTKSTNNIKATFRTPPLPRKKMRDEAPRTDPKMNPRSLILVHDQKLKYESQHQLADIQVECSNKDRTILEQDKHMDGTKEEVQKLQSQLEELFKKQTQMEEQHKKDMKAIDAELQQEILNGYDANQAEMDNLRYILLEASEEKGREIQARKIMEGDLKNRIAEFSRRVSLLESELANKKYTGEEKVQTLENQIPELTVGLETEDHRNEMCILAQEKSELNSRIDNLNDERDQLESKLQKRQNVILELQAQLSALQYDLNESKTKCQKLEDSAKQVDDLRYKHYEEIERLKETFEAEKTTILNISKLETTHRIEIEIKAKETDKFNNFLKEELQNVQRLYEDVSNRLKEAHQELEESDKKYNNVIKKHTEDLTNLMRQHEEEKLKLNHRLEHTKQDYLKEIDNVKSMTAELRNAVEEEMRMTAERYKACFVRAETARAALDEKLLPKDVEISTLSLTQGSIDYPELVQIRAQAAEMVARRKRFEIVMAENQASVGALTKRIAQSDPEVQRLPHELKRGEDCINEHRDLLTVLRNNSKAVHEQVLSLMEQLDVRKWLDDQLEAESLSEVESLKSLFEAKIDDLKAECAAKTAENSEIKNQLHEMANHLNEARNMLRKLEETNDTQKIEISRVELLNTKLSEQLIEREAILQKHAQILEDQSKSYKAELDEAKSKIEDPYDKIKNPEERNKHLEDKTKSFEEERLNWETSKNALMKQLEEEKSQREILKEENKRLTEYNERILNNYQELNEKYAELAGHQNHKQRIKHLSQLKDKISQLEQDLNNKTKLIEDQQKIIDKLKANGKRAHIRGKENMLSVSKNAASTPLSSSHKPLTPLTNRNN